MVDEEGRFTELAGAELQNKSVMTEGNATGEREIDEGKMNRWRKERIYVYDKIK